MTIRDIQGRVFQPGFIADIPSGNLVWVDAVNGNDDLAVRGRMTVPFKTMAKAKNAAVSGDTIVVLPGSYTTAEQLAKAGVNWHFLNGTLAQGTAPTTPLFLVNSAMTFNVTGAGVFTPGGTQVLEVTNSSANIYFQARSILGTECAIKVTAGSSVIVEADLVSADESSAIDCSGGTLRVKAREIFSDSLHAVNMASGSLDIDAFQLRSNGGKGINFTGGTARIRAFEILAAAGPAVEYNNNYGAVLSISGARLVSTYASANGRAVNIVSSSTTLKLKHCALIANRTGTVANSIGAVTGTPTVNLYGECSANSTTSLVTIASPGSPLNQNVNLT